MSGGRSSTTDRCPACGRAADRRQLRWSRFVEPEIARRLAEEVKGWKRSHGACFRCVSFHRDRLPPLPQALPGRRGEILALDARLRTDPSFLGRGVTVAFVDSDFTFHPEFTQPRNRIAAYVNARRAPAAVEAAPPPPYIASWHGTMVAGAAFGSGVTEGGRYPGLAPAARLVFVSIAGPNVKIGETESYRGLRWVLAHHEEFGIRIVNLSVGADVPRPSRESRLDRLVERCVRAGIVVVAAAGNRPDRKPTAPASSPFAVTVGGIDDRGRGEARPAVFPGSHGPTLDNIVKPDCLAPSIWVPAPMVLDTPQAREAKLLHDLEGLPDRKFRARALTWNHELRLPAQSLYQPEPALREELRRRREAQKYITRSHQHVDGTSFACAIVAAVAAQILEANPALGPEQVKLCLMATACPLEGVPRDVQGAGVVNPYEAVAMARALGGADPTHPRFHSPVVEPGRVLYRFHDPARFLRSVEWAGSIGGWKPMPLCEVDKGVFELSRPRPAPGRYPYKFLLGDGRWCTDLRNPEREPDGMGGWNSVLVVKGH